MTSDQRGRRIGGLECADAQTMLDVFVDGELDMLQAVDSDALVSHLHGCSDCGAYIQHLRSLKERLACSRQLDVPADVREQVLAKVERAHARYQAGPHAGDVSESDW